MLIKNNKLMNMNNLFSYFYINIHIYIQNNYY